MPGKPQKKNVSIRKAKLALKRLGVDALLVSSENNVKYLAGFYSLPALLLIKAKGRPVYFVDGMNLSLAKRSVDKEIDVFHSPGAIVDNVALHIKNQNCRKVAINSLDLTVALHERLKKLSPKTRFISQSGKVFAGSLVQKIREIKTPEEARILRKAAKETVKIWSEVKRKIKPGMTEEALAELMDLSIKERGYDNSFQTIAAFGKNSAYPHAIPTSKKLGKNEHVLLDFGIRLKGYCSDLTRTLYNDRIDRQIREFDKYVRQAHDLAIKRIKPGLSIGTLTKDINTYFNKHDLGDYILHGLGHGVGMDVHERPALFENSTEVLRKGMVVTVEPGLYKIGLGGVRLEDMVLVTDKGCEVLSA